MSDAKTRAEHMRRRAASGRDPSLLRDLDRMPVPVLADHVMIVFPEITLDERWDVARALYEMQPAGEEGR